MCGICGIISLKPEPVDLDQTGKMVKSLKHRGPDGDGLWTSSNQQVNFGHTRLSIIDLDKRSGQPFLSFDERYSITFNGEIYNFLELRKECEELGSIFKTESDTEVLLESYRQWGTDCFKRFKGMWAAVIYDAQTNEICISRDFFGIKPLYLAQTDSKIYFASEIKALKLLGDYFAEKDETTVKMFIDHGILDRGNWTFYKNIKRFPHCSFSIIKLNDRNLELDYQIYWSPFDASHAEHMVSEEKIVSRFKTLFENSVNLHCRSDVEVGSCLSGGLDSSSIVALATRSNKNFATFTTKFPDYPEIDESGSAARISERYGTNQHFAEPGIQDFEAYFDEMLISQDEPYGSTSIFSQYMVFRKIKETGIKVVLDGQGADEQLGGYFDLTNIALNTLFRSGQYIDWLSETFSFSKNHKKNYFKNFPSMMKAKLLGSRKSKASYTDYVRYKYSESLEERMASLMLPPNHDIDDYLTYLTFDSNLQQLLRYEDRNSMHFSIESRVPFLEPELVSFILQISYKYKFRKGYTKYILRKAFENELPSDINWQKNKLGFASPEKSILKQIYGIEVDAAGSLQWRNLIVSKWRELND